MSAVLSGNKGEWSEIYVFLRLLAVGKLFAADENLNKMDSVFYDVLKIFREEEHCKLEFNYNKAENTVSVVNTSISVPVLTMPADKFRQEADYLYDRIVNNGGNGAFYIEETEKFLNSIQISKIKAASNQKEDIVIKLHDLNNGCDRIQGFSIKSKLGSPSTLINAGTTTNFIYKVHGPMNETICRDFNQLNTLNTFKKKFDYLKSKNCNVAYCGMESSMFQNNLRLMDSNLPEITGYLVLMHYRDGYNNVREAISRLTEINPLGFDYSDGQPFYEYKFKRLLTESALGMTPSKTWDGTANATGGYIIVKENGEVLCYHLYNRNEFENYLLNNTKFETASTSRHKFGTIYQDKGDYYLKLNLQVRFNQ